MGPLSRSVDMTMPVPIVAIVATLALVFVIRGLRHLDDAPTRFLVLALWARFVLSALHVYTITPIVGGLSINAVSSIMIASVSIWLAGWRLVQLRHAASIYLVLIVIVVSAAINNRPLDMVEYVFRYLFLLGVALLTYRGIRLFGSQRLLKALLPALITPFVLQIISIILGITKSNELAADTAAYIGGYYHESAFSMIVLFLIAISTLIKWKNPLVGLLFVIGGCISLIYANYRTNLIAALPMILVTMYLIYNHLIPSRLKPVGVVLSVAAFGIIVLLIPYMVSDRYAEIFKLINEGFIFLEDPQILSREQRTIFSSRVSIWANYFEAYRNGDVVEWIIGQGPSAWKGIMRKNSHNTFVGYTFEFGIIGLSALFIFILHQFLNILRLEKMDQRIRAGACFLGWLIANLATEPFYAIEGLLLVGTVIGFTWAMLPTTISAVPEVPRFFASAGSRPAHRAALPTELRGVARDG